MRKYNLIFRYKKLLDEIYRIKRFKRLTGIKRETFEKMLEILFKAEKLKKSSGGKPSDTSLEDKLLMSLEYWREYRTYFISKLWDIRISMF